MARGKKTGGRNFPKGNRGRPHGAKDKVPRGSMKAILQYLVDEVPQKFVKAGTKILDGKGQGMAKVSLMSLTASYVDGKPEQTVKHSGTVEMVWPD